MTEYIAFTENEMKKKLVGEGYDIKDQTDIFKIAVMKLDFFATFTNDGYKFMKITG